MRPCGLLWAPYGLLLNRMGTYETVWVRVRVPIRSHMVFSSTLATWDRFSCALADCLFVSIKDCQCSRPGVGNPRHACRSWNATWFYLARKVVQIFPNVNVKKTVCAWYMVHSVRNKTVVNSLRFVKGSVYFTGNSGYRSSKIVVCGTGNIRYC